MLQFRLNVVNVEIALPNLFAERRLGSNRFRGSGISRAAQRFESFVKARAFMAGSPGELNLRARQCAKALTIDSTVFLASPNNIIVLFRKNSSFSTPA